MAGIKAINCRGNLLSLEVPLVMGIINVTPDSFYAGSRYNEVDIIKRRAEEIRDQGGKIIDIGGVSSRPGATDVSVQEEMERLCIAVESVRSVDKDIPISIDTFRSEVAEECISKCKADIINDISGGQIDENIFEVASKLKVPYILTHTVGCNVQAMQQKVEYSNIAKDIFRYFAEKINKLRALGANDVILDPGFGFAKDIEQNYELLVKMSVFKQLGMPLLVGISRKRMVWQVLGSNASEALNGTTALNMFSLMNGADILRVHDVKEAAETVRLYLRIRQYAE